MMIGIISLRNIRGFFVVLGALASLTFPHAITAARERFAGAGEVISASANDVISENTNNRKKILRTVQNVTAASAAALTQAGNSQNSGPVMQGAVKTGATSATLTQAGILYNGGPVMEGPVNVYFIYYGDWSNDSSGKAILVNLLTNIGNTPFYKIQQSYTNAAGTPLSATVNFKGGVSSTYGYSNGILLSDTDIENIVRTALAAGQFPVDANGVYFVLTSPDVQQGSYGTPEFCHSECGWHNYFFTTNTGVKIKFSFVGNPANCLCACSYSCYGNSPNGNPGIDAMASVIIHELEEAQSDPELNAWFDSQGYENADKCAWTYGTLYTASNGAQYNVVVGSKKYLLQQNWLNKGIGLCAMTSTRK